MTSSTPKPWVEVVLPHPDVLSESFSEDVFALDLGPLADGNPNVPAVYRNPEQFFRTSVITSGLGSLLEDVLSRLTGGAGSRVLKLMTPFGGGKSHTLAALLHGARTRKALDVLREGKGFPRPNDVRTAVFDGNFFDASTGKELPRKGARARTMWGWIAWSLGGQKGYDLLRVQDEACVAPGGDEILKLLADGPNLILLDEVLQYLISAGGVKVLQTTLRDETMIFLQRLTTAVGNTTNTALVFSLQSSKRESLEYLNLLQTVDHLAARKDQRREPVEGNEVLAVIQRRLLGKAPEEADSDPAATAYQEVVTQMRRAYARTAAEKRQAEEEGVALRDRVRAAYPFHPALIDLMRERWAAIPDFQRTRGALRFLAACLRAAKRESKSRVLLGPGDVPMYDAEVRRAFFKEVGQQADFQAVLEHDLVGANARARRIDERRALETPSETGKRPATRLATAILMFSFGGLRRDGGKDNDMLPSGVSETELLAACVGPDLDSTTALACLKELKEQCLYLHYDGVRYCFKKDPNVTLLVEQEADAIARNEASVEERIKEMLETRLAAHSSSALLWPKKSGEIPNDDPGFLVAYLPLEFRAKSRAEQEAAAKELLEKYGDKPRKFRNGVGLALPSTDQIEGLRRAVRYLLAVEQVKAKGREYHLSDEQKSQLREREGTERNAAETALLDLYKEVWLPKLDGGGIVVDVAAPGGRPLQTRLNDKKEAMIHERVMEILTASGKPRVFSTVSPTKLVELFKLGTGNPPALGIRTAEVVEGFYSFLGFTRLTSDAVVRACIAKGVGEGKFGLVAGEPPQLGPDGKYQVARSKVRIGQPVNVEEVDLESGFILLPQAIPPSAPAGEPGLPVKPATPPGTPTDGGGPTPPNGPPPVPVEASIQKTVDLVFKANRDELFKAWNAVANLVDLAGQVSVTVHAESEKGFDKGKLQNGVLEPLREADLIE